MLNTPYTERPVWLRLTVSLACVALAAIGELLLGPIGPQIPFLLFLGAITVAAWYGGLLAGLLASALSAIASMYFLLPPYGTLDLADTSAEVRLVLFLAVALLISGLSHARSLAEKSIYEQRESLRVTLASIGDAVIAVDAGKRVTFMNAVAEKMTGWNREQAIGQRVHDVFRIVNEQTRAEVANPVDRVLTEGVIVGLANHTVLLAKDGSEHPIDDSGAPIRDDSGNVTGAILVFRDITGRRKDELEKANLLASSQQARLEAEAARDTAMAAEQRLAFLADASRILVASLDYETTLQAVAQIAVPHIADWCTVDLLSQDGVLERLAVAHIDPTKVEWAHELQRRFPPDPKSETGAYRVVRTGEPELYPEITDDMLVAGAQNEEQLTILRAIGFTSAIVVPLIARDLPLGVLTFVSAESGRKYGEEDMALAEGVARRASSAIDNARLYNEAQAAVKARDQFLSVASHELKTPLTAMRAYAQLVQRRIERTGQTSDKDLEALGLVVKQTDRLNRMITSLLDLSRIQSGQLSLEKGLVDVCRMTENIVDEMRATTHRHKLELVCPSESLIVEGDELRLEQVLLNLLQNAVKYDPTESLIRVTVEGKDASVNISVTDSGMGIPEAAQGRLFERFYRATNVNTQHISGMGIGLYVVHEIVALHGGDVSVYSKEGEGSTFTIRLPLAATPDAQGSNLHAAPSADSSAKDSELVIPAAWQVESAHAAEG